LLDRFFGVWNDQTRITTHFTFGNHDLVGTKNPKADRTDPRFGKGLYRKRLGLDHLYYAFEESGWRFLILDDVNPNEDGTYYGAYPDEQLAFLKTEFQKEPVKPTVLCGHIPTMSITPTMIGATKLNGSRLETADSLVVENGKALLDVVGATAANVKLVLAGHLHHQEKIEVDGVTYLNGGAVCGNWWKGSVLGCPEGFTIVDLFPDGKILTEYRTYSWKAG
jgi:3',5'-cyclic-AMP phosphodiesterase